MKDILQDVVAHTHALGFLSIVKVTNENGTTIESMADDRSVILGATTHTPVGEFEGTFGMPNLDKLALHLKNPEYQKDAKLDVVKAERNGQLYISKSTQHTCFLNHLFQNSVSFGSPAIIV